MLSGRDFVGDFLEAGLAESVSLELPCVAAVLSVGLLGPCRWAAIYTILESSHDRPEQDVMLLTMSWYVHARVV